MFLLISKLYGKIYAFFHFNLKINLRGFGWLLRNIKNDFNLYIKNKIFWFDHRVADNYALLINGEFNEPETHYFIDNLLKINKNYKFRFIDIGANIGEFVFDYGDNEQIDELIAFEPQEIQGDVIVKNINLNGFTTSKLIRKAVYNKVGTVRFNREVDNQTSSGIREAQNENFIDVPCTTIDHEFLNSTTMYNIILIDAEGAELEIIKGGNEFIKQNLPVIIFEYNHVSRTFFNLDEIRSELGVDYEIYRLNSKGKLDKNMNDTWNMVAYNKKSNLINA